MTPFSLLPVRALVRDPEGDARLLALHYRSQSVRAGVCRGRGRILLVPQAATSIFALLVGIMLLDVITGFSVSIRVAQRDVARTGPSNG